MKQENKPVPGVVPSPLEKTMTFAKESIETIVSRAKTYGAAKIKLSFSGSYKIKHSQVEKHNLIILGLTSEPDALLAAFTEKLGSLNPVERSDKIESLQITWKGLDKDGQEIPHCFGTEQKIL